MHIILSQTNKATSILFAIFAVHTHTLSKLLDLIKSSFSQASNYILVLTIYASNWLRNSGIN